MRVMVTGAGGPASVCVIKSLSEMKDAHGKSMYEIIKTDVDPLAPGLYFGNRSNSHIVPRVDNNGFMGKMLELARSEKTQVILPTVQEELIYFARNIDKFKSKGITVAVSNVNSLLRSNNKLETYAFFKGAAYCPEIYDGTNVKFPAVVKPFDSRGGRGFFKAENEEELKVFLSINDRSFGKGNSLVMEYLPGTEYSTYGFSDLSGVPLAVVPIKRIAANGTSTKAEIVDHPKVKSVASEIATKLELQGPWNIQLMESGDNLKLVEVNPRFAGTSILLDHAGLHLPHLTIQLFTGQKIKAKELQYRSGVIMTRYAEEQFIERGELIK
jgi:carbamoyl-phosphate synthase large subunit